MPIGFGTEDVFPSSRNPWLILQILPESLPSFSDKVSLVVGFFCPHLKLCTAAVNKSVVQ